GLNWSPAPMSTGMARYGKPHSSSMIWPLWPFGVAHEYTSIMAGCLLEGLGDEQYIMLDAVRRWLVKGDSLPAWHEFAARAEARRWTLRRTMAHDGWVMDNNA